MLVFVIRFCFPPVISVLTSLRLLCQKHAIFHSILLIFTILTILVCQYVALFVCEIWLWVLLFKEYSTRYTSRRYKEKRIKNKNKKILAHYRSPFHGNVMYSLQVWLTWCSTSVVITMSTYVLVQWNLITLLHLLHYNLVIFSIMNHVNSTSSDMG